MKKFILSKKEQAVLISLLYNHLSFGTTLEVFGELNQEGIARLDSLRSIFGRLLKSFSLSDKLSQDTYLILGMTKLIKKSSLEKWSKEENNKHLQNRAKYFLKKCYEKQKKIS